MNKITKKRQSRPYRIDRAYCVASETVLFMHIEGKPVTVDVTPDDGFCYVAKYAPTDFRTLIIATIGVLTAITLRSSKMIDRSEVYQELLELNDPNSFFDKITADEVMNLITLALWLLTSNWHVVESIATKLLSHAPNERAVVSFAPAEYSFTK